MTQESLAEAIAPDAPAGDLRASRSTGERLMASLGLAFDSVLDDDSESFATLLCRDQNGRRVALKYVHSGSADAYRRLTNESQLVKHLRVRLPLRLLPYRSHARGYLVTDFDPGVLLRPDRFDDRVMETVGEALAQFQSMRPDVGALGLVDREGLSTYYIKVLLKHLLHLWPAHLSAREAARSLALVTAALSAIRRRSAICHGDLIPTNLLHHADDGSITVTDLEGFMCRNHPLFDLLAFFTISGLDLADWTGQRLCLARYLAAGASSLGLDPASRDYRDAYRGILTFFLVYRLNEERILLKNGAYFDGAGQLRFIARKAAAVVSGRRSAWRDDSEDEERLVVRKRNLRWALSTALFEQHFDAMHASVGSPEGLSYNLGRS